MHPEQRVSVHTRVRARSCIGTTVKGKSNQTVRSLVFHNYPSLILLSVSITCLPGIPFFFLPFFFILRGFSESSLNATTSSITIPTINLPESGLGLFVENSSCELANGKHKIFRFKEINFWICSMNRDIFEKHLFIKYFVGKWKNLFDFREKLWLFFFFFSFSFVITK